MQGWRECRCIKRGYSHGNSWGVPRTPQDFVCVYRIATPGRCIYDEKEGWTKRVESEHRSTEGGRTREGIVLDYFCVVVQVGSIFFGFSPRNGQSLLKGKEEEVEGTLGGISGHPPNECRRFISFGFVAYRTIPYYNTANPSCPDFFLFDPPRTRIRFLCHAKRRISASSLICLWDHYSTSRRFRYFMFIQSNITNVRVSILLYVG